MAGPTVGTAPQLELSPTEGDGECNRYRANSKTGYTGSDRLNHDFVILRKGRRGSFPLFFTVAGAALACAALAYMIVSCSLALGRLPYSSESKRQLAAGQGEFCAPQEGGDTGDVVGDDGVPTAPMLPALEVEAQDEEEVSQAGVAEGQLGDGGGPDGDGIYMEMRSIVSSASVRLATESLFPHV
ncbi:hypothetical protein, conserved [Eimeria maxima]|uniref:Uncharacterized protein n=1 Tax=Eimeria maxima TaxID=5804 RepID=U6MCP4_EIMMA|nr:hypothetical protein, conserved [Eimeria maxima]CDJ59435.1 hypothetical protein, conserved [Eimeria maxima]